MLHANGSCSSAVRESPFPWPVRMVQLGVQHCSAEKIARAAVAEMEAAERAARQQLRVTAARAAADRAAALVRQRMNPAAENALFSAFLGELERGAQ